MRNTDVIDEVLNRLDDLPSYSDKSEVAWLAEDVEKVLYELRKELRAEEVD